VNIARDKPLTYFAVNLETINNIDQITEKLFDPMIRVIDIDVAKKLFNNNTLFVDARDQEYYNDGHIPKAICNEDLNLLIGEIENYISYEDSFVVYCSDDDCGSSEELAYLLQGEGFMNIYLFKGGWKQWMENSLPIDTK
tara:strand:- start:24 stop:443 length:420 start_codon:yes stop_codon:yes gene_type:complete